MIALILILLAFVCFILAALSIGAGRINLVAAGLALWLFVLEILPRL